MMKNIELIDSVSSLLGGDIIDANFHWSSSQVIPSGNSTNYAYGVSPFMTNLDTGKTFPYLLTRSKNMPYLVRAVRCIDSDCSFELTSINQERLSRIIIKKTDLLGRDTKTNKGLQLYIYDDGSVEKKYIVE